MDRLALLIGVFGCASVPPAEVPGPREHHVQITAEGRFVPPDLVVRPGDSVAFHLRDRRDAILPLAEPPAAGTCPRAAPWQPGDLTGPMRVGPSGVFSVGPFDDDRGLVATRAQRCSQGKPEAVVGDERLCAVGALGEIASDTWENDSLSGVHVRLLWSAIQPARGRFAFDDLARELDRAVAARKVVNLSVKAGKHGTPDWIFDAGVERLRFRDGSSDAEGCGQPMDLGSPTDPAYARLWGEMHAQLAAFVRSRADWYQTLGYTHPSGANLFSAEARLPVRCDPGCEICNTEVWARSGYRPSKLYAFFDEQEAQLASLFPGKMMSLMSIGTGFPRVTEDGCWLVGEGKEIRAECPRGRTATRKDLPEPSEQGQALITRGISRFGPLFVAQHNGLGPAPARGACRRGDDLHPDCPNKWVTEAGERPGQLIAFQTHNDKHVDDPVTLDAALSNAWDNSNAVLVEIYEQRAWEAQRAEAAGRRSPSGLTIAQWDERFHERRRTLATGALPDPHPMVHDWAVPAHASGTLHYTRNGPCDPQAVGTIRIAR